ncbi:MAG: hypothetical protein BWK76_27800 [Desulfobulbaceae bacterium A2]|nr:MAG: hypothetical protein BWK76_27800 [Desulfobulbaceae bacterium A2]
MDIDSALLAADLPGQVPVDRWDRYWSKARDHAAEKTRLLESPGFIEKISAPPAKPAGPPPSAEAAQVAESITKTREPFGAAGSPGSEVTVGGGPLKGVSDALTYHPESKTMVVLDAKFSAAGSGPDAAKNEGYFDQLMTYAAMALDGYPETKEVALGIARPFAGNGGGTEVKTISRDALDRWKKEILDPAVKMATSDNAPFRPGPVCGGCPARPICPHAKR